MILSGNVQLSVGQALKNGGNVRLTNDKVYLAVRGSVYEHLAKAFQAKELDRAFTKRNKEMKKHLTGNAMFEGKSLAGSKLISSMTKKQVQKDRAASQIVYTRKFISGKVFGLQNLIPEFFEQGEVVFFTDNDMVAEIYELQTEPLKKAITENKEMLTSLWTEIMPSALLQLDHQNLMKLPEPLLHKDWKSAWKLLNQYSTLHVLEPEEQISLPAGGFLLQGSMEQII